MEGILKDAARGGNIFALFSKGKNNSVPSVTMRPEPDGLSDYFYCFRSSIHADVIYFIRRAQPQLANVFYSFKHYCCVGLFDTLNPADFSQDDIDQLFVVMCPDRTRYHMFAS